MKTLFLILALSASLTACTQPDRAVSALEAAGYSDIQIGGWAAFSCSNSDQYATEFTAKGPTGRVVSGAVCSGVLKGSTIRMD
jgi:hypothetical protein